MAETTLEWPTLVSGVSFTKFWGVIRLIKVVSAFHFGDRKLPNLFTPTDAAWRDLFDVCSIFQF